jgi:hypothetical protein
MFQNAVSEVMATDDMEIDIKKLNTDSVPDSEIMHALEQRTLFRQRKHTSAVSNRQLYTHLARYMSF